MSEHSHRRGLQFGQALPEPAPGASVAPRAAANPLERWFDAHTEGHGVWKWRHYFEVYHRHFARFVGRDVHVLEIGVFSGGSLEMWRHYFGPRCHVYGIDVREECRAYEGGNTRIFIGDQADRAFWKEFRAQVPTLDIVIDDGGHHPEQQIVSLEELLPHLRPGGVYVCEDIYHSLNDFHDYVAGLTHPLNHWGGARPGVTDPHHGLAAGAVQRSVHSVHQYPFITVIEKTEAPVAEFTAPMHGTKWQPL